MRYRFVITQLGVLMMALGAVLGGIATFAAVDWAAGTVGEGPAAAAFGISSAMTAGVGFLMWFIARGDTERVDRRQALLLVAVSWFVAAFFGAMPFLLWGHLATDDHAFRSIANALFESTSGITTTGATILGDIDALPRSLNLWRCLSHWLGGLGIVVLFVAVLPSLGVGGRRLFRAEAPGPTPDGLHPQIKDTARALLLLYSVLTIVETAALMVAGLGWFDAVCHAFSTMATGGFSSRSDSAGLFASLAVDIIIIVFMAVAGANFGLLINFRRNGLRETLRDPELRVYGFMLLVASTVITLSILHQPIALTTGLQAEGAGAAVRHAVFQTVSMQTSTGLVTADFNAWPFAAQATIVTLMFVGGCAGSTAGGIKVIRVWIAIRVMAAEIERVFRPNVVRPIRIGGASVSPELRTITLAYVLGVGLLFIVGAVAIRLIEADKGCDFTTAATASVACLCTMGPGLGRVGALENYEWLSDASKALLIVWMIIGRLEVLPILVLISPRFWQSD